MIITRLDIKISFMNLQHQPPPPLARLEVSVVQVTELPAGREKSSIDFQVTSFLLSLTYFTPFLSIGYRYSYNKDRK